MKSHPREQHDLICMIDCIEFLDIYAPWQRDNDCDRNIRRGKLRPFFVPDQFRKAQRVIQVTWTRLMTQLNLVGDLIIKMIIKLLIKNVLNLTIPWITKNM